MSLSLIAIPLWPISSTTNNAVSWSITSLIVATTPSDIRFLTTSAAFIAISLASSPTWIISGTSISFWINSVGASNLWELSGKDSSLPLYALTALDNCSFTSTLTAGFFEDWAACFFLSISFLLFSAACFNWSSRFFCSILSCSVAAALLASISSE